MRGSKMSETRGQAPLLKDEGSFGGAPSEQQRLLQSGQGPPLNDCRWILWPYNGMLVLLFFSFVWAPFAALLMGWESGQSIGEKRRLVSKFSWKGFEKLPGDIESYYQDNFGCRGRLIRAQAIIRHRWLSASTDKVIVGKDHWLFWSEPIKKSLLQPPLTLRQLGQWKAYLEKVHSELKNRGIAYQFIIAPEKDTIYPEMLPGYLQRKRVVRRAEQLLQYLKASASPVEILDLAPVMKKEKTYGDIYFKNDSHWNGKGWYHYLSPGHVKPQRPVSQPKTSRIRP